MIRVGVISDTHIPKAASDLPQIVYDKFQNVDMILHAGDLVEYSVFEKLLKIAPTHAVSGNMDMDYVRASLPQKDIINAGGFKIGLIHGWGPPNRIQDVIAKEFGKVDVIVFGHSHSSFNEVIKGTLFFNPGSPTDKIFATQNSFGILEINSDIKGSIVRL